MNGTVFFTTLMLQVLMSRGNVGKGPMKDAFIMSSLPPEDDPLFAGLQGVDSVIEHFIKNAQGKCHSYFINHFEHCYFYSNPLDPWNLPELNKIV